MCAQSPLNTIQANSSNLKVFATAKGNVQNNMCSIERQLIRKNVKVFISGFILFPIEMNSYSCKLPWIKICRVFLKSDFNWVYSIEYSILQIILWFWYEDFFSPLSFSHNLTALLSFCSGFSILIWLPF